MESSSKARVRLFRIAALVSYAVGFYYVRFAAVEGALNENSWVHVLIFTLIFIAAVEAFSCLSGRTPEKMKQNRQAVWEAWLMAVCAILQAVAALIYGYHSGAAGSDGYSGIEVYQILFWHFTMVYYVLCRTGMLAAGRTGILFPLDSLEGIFYLPWKNIFFRFICVFQRQHPEKVNNTADQPEDRTNGTAEHTRTILVAVITGIIALTVFLIAWTQLTGVTDSFGAFGHSVQYFFRRIFTAAFWGRFCSEFLIYFVLSIPVSAWLFGLVGGSLRREKAPCSAETFEENTREFHVLPVWSAYVIIGVLLAVYAMFFAVSAREIGWMFAAPWNGIQAYEASDAAIRGFWQLVRVDILNFAVLLGSCLFSDVPLWERRKTKVLAVLMFIFTLLFGFLAFWKLFVLYIGIFGVTPRRALSGWVLSILLLWTVLTLIRFYKKIPAARIGILTAAVSFSILMLFPMG